MARYNIDEIINNANSQKKKKKRFDIDRILNNADNISKELSTIRTTTTILGSARRATNNTTSDYMDKYREEQEKRMLGTNNSTKNNSYPIQAVMDTNGNIYNAKELDAEKARSLGNVKSGIAQYVDGKLTNFQENKKTDIVKNMQEEQRNFAKSILKTGVDNLKTDLGIIGSNLKDSAETGILQLGKTFGMMSDNAQNTQTDMQKMIIENTIKERKKRGLETKEYEDMLNSSLYNEVDSKPFYQEKINKINQRMAENTERASNPVTKKIAELSQSIGNNIVGMGTTAINPALGFTYFTGSAAGSYYDEAIEKGMNDNDARNYASIMGLMEGATEKYLSAQNLKSAKAIAEGTGIKNALKSFGLEIGENFTQEAIMPAISELTTKAVAGNEYLKYDYSTAEGWQKFVSDSLSDGIDGALSAILLNGTTKGISSCINITNKIKNGANITKQEVKTALSDAQKSGIDVETIIKEKINEATEKNKELELAQGVQNNSRQQTILNDIKTPQNQNKAQLDDMLNNKELPMQKYVYEKSNNQKIDNLRQDANKYFNNSEKAHNYMQMLEKIIEDKDIDIRLDANLKTPDNKIANGSYSNGVITINPNSTRTGEFIAVHELTHAIGTEQMKKMIDNYRKSNKEFNSEVEGLLQNYNSTEITEEALSDVSAQLFGNQEFINNIAQNNPNIFQKIYSEIKYLWHQFRGYKNQDQFVEDLYYKWTQVYNSNNKLNETRNYHISSNLSNDIDNILINGTTRNKIQVRDFTPEALVDAGLEDLPMEMKSSHIRENILTLEQAKKLGLKISNKTHYHGLGKEIFIKAIDQLDSPVAIYRWKDNNGKNTYGSNDYIVLTELIAKEDGKDGRVIVPLFLKNINGRYEVKTVYRKNGVFKYLSDNKNYLDKLTIKRTNKIDKVQFPVSPKSSSNNSIPSSNKDVNTTTKYSIQENENNSLKIEDDEIKYTNNEGEDRNLYFRFDWRKEDFKGSKHKSMLRGYEVEDHVDYMFEDENLLFDTNGYYLNTYRELNEQWHNDEISEQEYDDKLDALKKEYIEEKLTLDGASAFKLDEYGIDFSNSYGYYDRPIVTVFAGTESDMEGHDGESVAKSEKIIWQGDSDILNDIFLDDDLTIEEKNEELMKIFTNNSDIKYSQNSKTWQSYLDKNFKPTGTRTNLEDVRQIAPYKNDKNVSDTKTKIAPTKVEEKNKKKEFSDKAYFPQNFAEVTEELNNNSNAELLEQLYNDKMTLKEQKDFLTQKFVNKGHYIDQLAKKTGDKELTYKYDRMLGAQAEGQYEIGVAQTDNYGNKIGKSINEIWKPVEENKMVEEFSDYLLNKHNIDRMKAGKPIFGEEFTSAMSEKVVENYEKLYPEFKKWSKDVNTFYKNQLKNTREAGLTSTELEETLNDMYENYIIVSRAKDSDYIAPKGKTTGVNSPIKRARGGNTDIQPLKDAMAKQAIAIKQAIRRNDVGLELLNVLKSVEDVNDYDVNNIVSQDKKGAYFIVFKEGKAKKIKITEGLYESLKNSQRYKLEKFIGLRAIRKFSNIQRSLLTVDNPIFMITNFFKDFQDGMFNSKYTSKFIKNYGKALSEIKKHGKYYNEYMANGGNSNTYFDYEKGVKKETKISKFIDKIRTGNEIIEMAPRLSEYISTREAGGSVNEALYNAAEITTNFKRGGDIAKALDRNGANFLNASIQGLSKQIRNLSGQNGIKGYVNLLVKATLLGVAPSMLNHLLLGDDDEYEKLPDYVKDTYYLFKIGDDKFLRIPKGRVLSIFGSAARRTLEYSEGNKEAFEGFKNTVVNQMAPNNPASDNILAPIFQASANKTWYSGDLVPTRLQDELPENQYDESTDSFSKWLGKITGISPMKINYVLDQYSGGVGDILLPMMTPQAENNVLTDKFTIDSTLKNKNVSKFYETIEEQTRISNAPEATDEDILKTKYLSSIQASVSDLYKEKREIQLSDLTDKVKKEEVKRIQKEINDILETGLEEYDKGDIQSNYATIGDVEYYKNKDNEWTKLTDEEKDKNKNISLETYADYKQKTYEKKVKLVENGGIKDTQSLKNKDKIQILLDSNYSNKEIKAIYENYIKSENDSEYTIINKTGINIKEYLKYKQQDFTSDSVDDGTTKGKTVSGSSKVKTYEYVNKMNITYEQRLMLLGMKYTLTDTEKTRLYNYVKSLNCTTEEKKNIFEKLKGFTVYKNGRVTW